MNGINKKYDELIVNAITNKSKRTIKTKFKGKILDILFNYNNIYKYISERFSDSYSFKESLYRLIFLFKENKGCTNEQIEIKPKCPVCNKPLVFNYASKKHPYLTYCSNSCAFKGNENRRQETNLLKYGSKNIGSSQIIIEKIQQTNLEKYGYKTCLLNDKIKEKIQQTNLERYGFCTPLKNEDVKNKIKQINLEKYGVEYVTQNPEIKEKINQTMLNKYGVKNPYLIKEIFEKAQINSHSKEAINKQKQTNIKKYGGESWASSSEGKQRLSKLMSSPEVQRKIYETHKKNNSFNTSKGEINVFNLIKEKYDDVISQYKEERYPFKCDYYIPSLDLFIEYQGSWTHGGKPFDKELDKDKALELKNSSSKYKNNVYKNWTKRDPNKRETAKKNNLNYLEIWPDWSNEKILEEIEKYGK